jgi:CHAD domain-containing protein
VARPRPSAPSAFVRRIAAGVWRRAAARLDAWRAPEPVRERPWATAAPTTAIDVIPRAGPTWTEHACHHIDRWIARLVGADTVQGARDVRRVRTAVRRLRTIVAAVAGHGATAHRDLDRALRRVAKRLGAVRDLDVAIACLDARRRDCDADLELAAIDELAAKLLRQREHALARAKRRLRADTIATVVAELRLFVASAITDRDGPTLAAQWWGTAFDRLRAAVNGLANANLDQNDDGHDLEGLHRVRIAARTLRHGIGFFDGVLPPEAQAWPDRVGALQRCLGEHRDAALFHARLVRRIDRATARGRLALSRGLDRGRAAAALAERGAWAASRVTLDDVEADLGRPVLGRSVP